MRPTYRHYKNKRNFFEGYFIKCCNKHDQIAIIPAFEVNGHGEVNASIQILTKGKSIYAPFTTRNFTVSKNYFNVQIADNEFNNRGVKLDFTSGDHVVKGKLSFGDFAPIKPTRYAPNIMGPFSYLKFMDCYHFIISTGHLVTGEIEIDGKLYTFDNDSCYIEGDYGKSFPDEWFFAQANCFGTKTSAMLSIAKLKKPKMTGLIGFIRDEHSGLDLVLGTYYLTKIKEFKKTPNGHKVTLFHGDYTIYMETNITAREKLLAPSRGRLTKYVNEATEGTMNLEVYKRDKLVYKGKSKNLSSECTLVSKF